MKLSKVFLIGLTGVFSIVLAACAPVEAQQEAHTATPGAPVVSPSATPGGEAGTPLPPAAVLNAQQWLAKQLNMPTGQITIVDMEQAEWSDSCLGLGQAHESCLQAITPGWRATFEVNGQQYEVRTNETGEHVRMVTPAGMSEDLADTAWYLVSFGADGAETSLVPGSAITLAFQPDGRIVGSGGCNEYGGEYQAHGPALLLNNVIRTERACADNQVTEQEARYFQALETAESYLLEGDRLIVRTAHGTLIYSRVPAGADEARVPGIVDFHADGADGVLEIPEAVQAGEAFEVKITTFGGGCEREGDTAVLVSAQGASIMVYDFTTATQPEVVCTAILKRLPHTVTLRFDEPGEKLLRIWGRRVGPETPPDGVPVVIEHTITVQ